MKPHVVLYASIGNNVPAYLIGGGETGTRRTIQILNDAGFETTVVDKAIMGLGAKRYIKMIVQGFCKIRKELKKDPNAIMFVVGYYERNLWFEWLVITMAKKMGHRCVYEARNGRLVNAFNAAGKTYQYFMLDLLNKADVVLCQGTEYVEFISKKLKKESVYVPNYVMDNKLRPYKKRRVNDTIKIVYSGRLVESKNLEVMINVVSLLKERGYNAELTLIGGGTEDYVRKLKDEAKKYNVESDVRFTGHISFDEASNYLSEAHYFLFPSQEIKEGHSNSLTEAMAFGVVPLVSTAGFSPSIVNDKNLVIPEIDPKKYVDKICEINQKEQWEQYSKIMFDRVRKLYTETCVREKIIKAFNSLV